MLRFAEKDGNASLTQKMGALRLNEAMAETGDDRGRSTVDDNCVEKSLPSEYRTANSLQIEKPVPKPRLSLLAKNKIVPQHIRCNSVPSEANCDIDVASPVRPPRRKSDCPVIPMPRTIYLRIDNEDSNETEETRYVIRNETKIGDQKAHSAKFCRFGNLWKNKKLLSLKRYKKENKYSNAAKEVLTSKPERPKRSPPLPPPVIHYKPAAPLPIYSCNEDGEEVYEDGSTIYHDRESRCTDDSDIYATVGDESSYTDSSDDHYETLLDYSKQVNSDDDLYQDAFQCRLSTEKIYEALPSEECVNKFNSQAEVFVESDNYCRKVRTNFDRKLDKKERKRELRAAKLRKKFNLTGEEIPVNAGIVMEDAKGAGNDLMVKKGEVVLILRMEGNPRGKWLVKDERGKIGFVDLHTIDVDPESIKSIMKIPELLQT
ncbi:FYN-binding protein-like protein [Dinothrombium tinctorium]|uniref:FYN-binding protein-like protein n=1 Tax=Dinothrombium tinctorium TaxID=1965070 RepID=A0A3S3NR74_9ACAR|nr:FYN-binding protein-like protein [Dinothrombium tinctorium]RWS07709.1 FYN-binding protein-like protein [Dinothrombium tinctorium]